MNLKLSTDISISITRLRCKFHQNRLSGYGARTLQNLAISNNSNSSSSSSSSSRSGIFTPSSNINLGTKFQKNSLLFRVFKWLNQLVAMLDWRPQQRNFKTEQGFLLPAQTLVQVPNFKKIHCCLGYDIGDEREEEEEEELELLEIAKF